MINNVMMQEVITFGSLMTAVVAVGLYLLERKDSGPTCRQARRGQNDPASSRHWAGLRGASAGIIHRAIKKAQAIVGQAELEGIKTVAASKFQTRELEEKFEKQMAETAAAKTDRILTGFGKQMEETVRKETERVKEELAEYKKKQMAAVDEKIVAMVGKTIDRVVSQKLNLAQHTELVFEALEKAKADEFFN